MNYFAELGFFFVVGVVFLWNLWRKRDFGPALQATVLLAGISVFIASFFRSGVISMNDLGARGFLPAQFVLLLWAAELFSHADPRPHGTHKLIAGTALEMGMGLLFNVRCGRYVLPGQHASSSRNVSRRRHDPALVCSGQAIGRTDLRASPGLRSR